MFKKIHVIRIKPGQDLMQEIIEYCEREKITSGVIIEMIGSLKWVNLGILKELPGKFLRKKMEGPLEIASAMGTIALKDGKVILHIHAVVSDENRAIGGHLAGGKVLSTAEVVIGEIEEQLERYKDEFTGLNELKGK